MQENNAVDYAPATWCAYVKTRAYIRMRVRVLFVRTNVAFKWTLSGERINYSLALFFLLLLEEMKRRFEKMKIGEDIYIHVCD